MASLRLELVTTARLNGHTWTEIARAPKFCVIMK